MERPLLGWVVYNFTDIPSKPAKYGQYLVQLKNGQYCYDVWNGSGWGRNNGRVVRWNSVLYQISIEEKIKMIASKGFLIIGYCNILNRDVFLFKTHASAVAAHLYFQKNLQPKHPMYIDADWYGDDMFYGLDLLMYYKKNLNIIIEVHYFDILE